MIQIFIIKINKTNINQYPQKVTIFIKNFEQCGIERLLSGNIMMENT